MKLAEISPEQPVLIAGPTASGKSALAWELVQAGGGLIINADALQVYQNWRVLTARPTVEEENLFPHALYGHVGSDELYSVGHWLREVRTLLQTNMRPIIVGGTGLYFTALTEGLADIPPTPDKIRQEAEALRHTSGLSALLAQIDTDTKSRIDHANPVRVQRAWEVQRVTGRSLADWQDNTPPPLLPLDHCTAIVLDAPKDWLTPRIKQRFDLMLDAGALEEARKNLATWDKAALSSKAIGAPELVAHLKGEISLEEAKVAAIIATRQYAKRQRTWFRSKMAGWQWMNAADL